MQRQAIQFVAELSRWMVVGGALALVGLAAGCGSSENLASVEGIVRLNGEPLSRGIVTFLPEAGRSASGAINSDGTFQLGTYDKADGALVGKHLVTITATEAPTGPPNFDVDRPNAPAPQALVPARYAVAGNGLTFDVKSDEANHAEFDLTNK
jgi:hypothetical protein